MTLNTDIFTHADPTLQDWDPNNAGYHWVPADFQFFTFIALEHPEQLNWIIANDVYRHLVFWEDIDSIHQGQLSAQLDTWLAREYNKAPPLWRKLLEAATTEKLVWNDEYYSNYICPSLWFLVEDWMVDQGINFVLAKIPSLTFQDDAVHKLVYFKNLSVQELAGLIIDGKIDDDDIQDDKYAEVYAEVRQR